MSAITGGEERDRAFGLEGGGDEEMGGCNKNAPRPANQSHRMEERLSVIAPEM